MKTTMSTDGNVWTVLGLDPPSNGAAHDTKVVKRAYAKALKAIDQTADPAGFQTLRQGYERALELTKVAKVETNWRRFASDIGAAASEIEQIDDLIHIQGTTVNPESQIALDALGDMDRVAVLDQSAESGDACLVLNALLAKSGGIAVTGNALAKIEQEGEAIWDNPIGVIETPVEYAAAKFSVIAAEQKLALLAINDESENLMFAIATKEAGQVWSGEKLDSHIGIYGVAPASEVGHGDLFRSDDTPGSSSGLSGPSVEQANLFHGDKSPQTVDAGSRYVTYVRMVDKAMAADGVEDDWTQLIDSLDDETPEMRDDIESMIFRALLDTQRSADGKERLPPSITAEVIDALDDQFQWLSDGVGFQRKFRQDADVMVVALNAARGRKTKFSKILQKPFWPFVSVFMVVLYAGIRTLIDWLTAVGVIS